MAPNIGKNIQKLLLTLNLDYKKLDPKECMNIIKKLEEKKISDYI